LNNELECLRKQKINGMIIRSRAKWTELGEKSSNYFCNLENKNFVNKNMQELRRDNGDIIVDQKDILKHQTTFYKKLYSENKHVDCCDENIIKYLNPSELQTLTVEESRECEGPTTTYEELVAALQRMKDNKRPGNDGDTAEFINSSGSTFVMFYYVLLILATQLI
jgi:hypothetical protein